VPGAEPGTVCCVGEVGCDGMPGFICAVAEATLKKPAATRARELLHKNPFNL
jgi:hypothetical protein